MRVVVLHDVFRAALFGRGGVNQVAAFWQSLLAPKLRRLGHALELPPGLGADRPAVLDELAARHGLAPEPGSWFRLFSDPAMLAAITGILAPLRGFDLVLGWELSPNIMRAQWSTPEEWGIWSEGEVATLRVQPRDAPDGLTLRLALTAFLPDPSRPPSLDIASRPAGVARHIVLDSPNPPAIDIALPAALCGDGLAEIVLRLRDLSSPADAGLPGDARQLGVGLMEAAVF